MLRQRINIFIVNLRCANLLLAFSIFFPYPTQLISDYFAEQLPFKRTLNRMTEKLNKPREVKKNIIPLQAKIISQVVRKNNQV